MANRKDDDINYEAEGATPPAGQSDPTDAGYDEAAHRGSEYGVPEGRGGVFGTTGGGSYQGGMHVEQRPAVGDADDESGKTSGTSGMKNRIPGKGSGGRDQS